MKIRVSNISSTVCVRDDLVSSLPGCNRNSFFFQVGCAHVPNANPHMYTQKKKIVSTGAIPTAKPYPKMTKASHVRNFRLLSLVWSTAAAVRRGNIQTTHGTRSSCCRCHRCHALTTSRMAQAECTSYLRFGCL